MDVSTLATLLDLHNTSDLIPGANTTGAAPANALPNKKIFPLLVVVYALGIIGNASAIITLRRGERRVRNRKHLLMLTSLAANDLVALVGMLCAMLVAEHVAGARDSRAYCVTRVALRVFGIGSVCIAVTMALERYVALTRPFLYQKQVTYYMIRMTLLVSWFCAALLTCAPILGWGLYFDQARCKCARYRDAKTQADFAYAVVYITFGTLLCLILVYCNLAVIKALYAITAPRGGGPVVRRVSKTSCRQRARASGEPPGPHHNAATAEEVAFSRLMATLSVLFMICWLPQMVTSALYLGPDRKWWFNLVAMVSDMLMLLNYVLNPILYVLQRRTLSLAGLCHNIAHCFKRSHKRSTESVTRSCCPETLVLSDSSAAELRPLRAPAPLSTAPVCAGLTSRPSALTLRLDD